MIGASVIGVDIAGNKDERIDGGGGGAFNSVSRCRLNGPFGGDGRKCLKGGGGARATCRRDVA